MSLWRDDLSGVDDLKAEYALARRAVQRSVAAAPGLRCRRRYIHPRQPIQFDKRRFLVIDTCECFMPMGHYDGCLCEHGMECRVYRVDADGREHYTTRPVCAAGDYVVRARWRKKS